MPFTAYASPADELDALVSTAARDGAVLFDVGRDADLAVVGRLLREHGDGRPVLAVGPSSVCEALAGTTRRPDPVDDGIERARGPVFVLAGSLSPVTARQVDAAASFRVVRIDPRRLAQDAAYADATRETIAALLRQGVSTIACSAPADGSSGRVADLPPRVLADAGARLLQRVLDAVPLSRIGLAGGDTSSLALQALDAWGLSHESRLAPGVALCRLHSDRPALDGCQVMLKGGQMGPVDVFERLLGTR